MIYFLYICLYILFLEDVPMRNESELFCICDFFIYIILYYIIFIFFCYYIFAKYFLYEFSMSKLFHSHPLIQFNFKTFQAPEIFFYLFFNHFQILCIEWLLCDGKYLLGCSANVNHSSWIFIWNSEKANEKMLRVERERQYTMFRSMR